MYSMDSHRELLDAVWRLAYIAEFREGSNLAHLGTHQGIRPGAWSWNRI